MEETVFGTDVPQTSMNPTVFGIGLGIVVQILGWIVLPSGTTTIGLVFFTVGVVLIFWSDQSWPDVGRVLTAVGIVLLIDDILTAVFYSGPLIPGL